MHDPRTWEQLSSLSSCPLGQLSSYCAFKISFKTQFLLLTRSLAQYLGVGIHSHNSGLL